MAAQRALRDQVEAIWPPVAGQTVAGFGFAIPLLRPYLATSRRVIALMPGQQGVMAWPPGAANVSVLCEETLWPLEAERIDRLLVPARAGDLGAFRVPPQTNAGASWRRAARRSSSCRTAAVLWARPRRDTLRLWAALFALSLEAKLDRHDFKAERHSAALFQPPSEARFWLEDGPGVGAAGTHHLGHLQRRRPDRGGGEGHRPHTEARSAGGGISFRCGFSTG